MIDFGIVIGSFLLSTFLMGHVIRWCSSKGLVDHANKRSSHTEPTPRGGGIIIVIMTLLAGTFYLTAPLIQNGMDLVPWFYICLLGGGLLVALSGLRDDWKGLKPIFKLLIHFISVIPAVYFLPNIIPFFSPLAEKIIIVLVWVWFINLYNFMDGADGLAGAQAVFLAAVLSLLNPVLKPLLLVMAGSTLGFLRVNISAKAPAKIFMGDVGSTFLGFMFAGIIFSTATWETLLALFALTLVFLGDATYTLIKRLIKGKKPWEAHKEHFYQRAIHKVGLTHTEVVIRATFTNIGLMIVVGVGLFAGLGPWVFILGLGVIAVPAIRIRRAEG